MKCLRRCRAIIRLANSRFFEILFRKTLENRNFLHTCPINFTLLLSAEKEYLLVFYIKIPPGWRYRPFFLFNYRLGTKFEEFLKITIKFEVEKSTKLNTSQTIILYQPILYSIAYKMVGSLEDAKDIVQDTFVKWLTVDHGKIKSTKSYLIKAVLNNSINHVKLNKNDKKEPLEKIDLRHLQDKSNDISRLDVENEVSAALVLLHKKLEPLEKAIYILREVFELEYDHLQEIFDKKKDNCRQLFCRAKEKVNRETRKIKTDFLVKKQPQFLNSFNNACSLGYLSDLINELKEEIGSKFSKN